MATKLTEQALEQAIVNDELELYYQPKVSLLHGNLVGAEALVRWNQADKKPIAPDLFIPLAESAGLLHDLTITLLDKAVRACAQIKTVRPGLSISMNVSPNDLESHTISKHIGQHLEHGRINAEDLQIEVTESSVMGNFERVQDDLHRLSDMRIKILMDDFGTGYSSIDRLSQLPFNSLKLDQGVVRRMGTSQQNLNVVKSALSMARELRMTSVAEGVESAGVYNFLIANGCEEAQGYYIARPMALDTYLGFTAEDPNLDGSPIGRVHQAIHNLMYFRKCILDAAFCRKLDMNNVLPSVMRPDIVHEVELSRFGDWLFTSQQQLDEYESFRALSLPADELFKQGELFMQELNSGAEDAMLNKRITGFDRQFSQIIQLLHELERDILLDTKQRY
jgi:EAL domain-containing protein (putative c-di-GMP-specific phosphodiesterase class I)